MLQAELYPECDGIQAAVKASLNLYEIFHNGGDLGAGKQENRKSLCSGFHDADASAIIAWNKRMQELVQMDEIAKDIRQEGPCPGGYRPGVFD